MKKRVITAIFITALGFSLMGCGANGVLREATGATYLQGRAIERWLSAKDIECVSIAESVNPLVEGMDTGHNAFDVVAADGNTYLLILRKGDNAFDAVLTSDGELLHGMVDKSD